jgi:hypothetical protein
MGKNRNYSYKDVDMLMASKTIAESFKANLSELSATRTDWKEQYSNDLLTKIDDAIENYLGVDAKKDLRDASCKFLLFRFLPKGMYHTLRPRLMMTLKMTHQKGMKSLKHLAFPNI